MAPEAPAKRHCRTAVIRASAVGRLTGCREVAARGRKQKSASSGTAKRHHVSAGTKSVEVVRPSLHHVATFIEMLCPVVGRSHLVSLLVRELQLDDVRRKAELVEQCRRHRTETMPAHLFAGITDPAQ